MPEECMYRVRLKGSRVCTAATVRMQVERYESTIHITLRAQHTTSKE